DAVGLVALALADARPAAGAFFTKLGFAGGPLAVLERAHADAAARAARVAAAGAPRAPAPEPRRAPAPQPPVPRLPRQPRGPRRLCVKSLWGGFPALAPRVVSLRGDDVVVLGVPRGPAVARVLAEMRDARLDGRLASRAMEEAYVRQWIAKGG